MTREAYSHEVISAGFWPGGGAVNDSASTPTPLPSRKASAATASASYNDVFGEYIFCMRTYGKRLIQSSAARIFAKPVQGSAD